MKICQVRKQVEKSAAKQAAEQIEKQIAQHKCCSRTTRTLTEQTDLTETILLMKNSVITLSNLHVIDQILQEN